jgi:hypothetical protein
MNTKTAVYHGMCDRYHKYIDTVGIVYFLLDLPRDAQGNYIPVGTTVTLTYCFTSSYGNWFPSLEVQK